MLEIAATIVILLVDVPVNFWFWLLIVVPPALVFAAAPKHSASLRFARLVLAIGAGYVFVVLGAETRHSLDVKALEECQEQYPFGSARSPEPCDPLMEEVVSDAYRSGAVFFGYVHAAVYVGFWEMVWRLWHRKTIGALGGNYRGGWFSAMMICFFLFGVAFFAFVILYNVFWR